MHQSLLLIVVLLPSSLSQLTRPTDVPSCHLPAGRAAVCVPIAACSHLASLVGNLRAPLPRDVALLLRDSFFCSGTGSSVQVCCPVEGKRGLYMEVMMHRLKEFLFRTRLSVFGSSPGEGQA